MSAQHQDRIARLRRLEQRIPNQAPPTQCPDGARLLALFSETYGSGRVEARRRALQRDLAELVSQGRIEIVNPGGKPLRYRRVAETPDEDPAVWRWTLQTIHDLAAEALPRGQLDRLWRHLLTNAEEPRLDEARLRVIPDTFRLQPVELHAGVLSAVIQALIQRCVLQVVYRNAEDERSEATLHPQALIQRGPIPYLFAFKNDETAPLRFYALHRMVRALARPETPARTLTGFDLDQMIADGRADFGPGELIDLELRVRGYLAEVVRVCPLALDQRLEDEPDGADFTLRVWARVPSTGQLLRWLLGAGDNLEVIAPPDLRRVVAAQTRKAAALYRSQ